MIVGVMRARFHVDADDRLAQRAQGFEAGVAEFEAELVFAFLLGRCDGIRSKWNRPGAGVVP